MRFLLFLTLAMTSCSITDPTGAGDRFGMPSVGVCAHRGASDTHPENTIAALARAVELGAHMIEFDVQLTSDGQLVLMHDATVDRTTDGTGKVSDLTLWQLKQLDAGSWKSREFAGERVPTLVEALRVLPRNIWLNIHLKGHHEGGQEREGEAQLGRACARTLAREGRLHQAFLACGTGAARAARASVPRIAICNMDGQSGSMPYVEGTIERGAAFIQLVRPREMPLTALVEKLDEHGVRVNYFGTNEPADLPFLFGAGVDFVLVDRVDRMITAARELGIAPLSPRFGRLD